MCAKCTFSCTRARFVLAFRGRCAHSDSDMTTQANVARTHLAATAHGTGSSPSTVTVTIGDVAHVVDVTPDRDDWTLPDCETVDAHRVLWAIDAAVEAYLVDADDACEPRRIERVWARAVAS